MITFKVLFIDQRISSTNFPVFFGICLQTVIEHQTYAADHKFKNALIFYEDRYTFRAFIHGTRLPLTLV